MSAHAEQEEGKGLACLPVRMAKAVMGHRTSLSL